MCKIILSGYIEVNDSDLDAVLRALPNHIALTKNEPGCLVFEVIQDSNNPNRFTVYEEFKNQSAFDFHQNRSRNSDWWKVTTNVTRHYQIEKTDRP